MGLATLMNPRLVTLTFPRKVMAANKVASGSACSERIPKTVAHDPFYSKPSVHRPEDLLKTGHTDFWNLSRYSCACFLLSCSPPRIVITAPRTSEGAKASSPPLLAISDERYFFIRTSGYKGLEEGTRSWRKLRKYAHALLGRVEVIATRRRGVVPEGRLKQATPQRRKGRQA